MADAILKAVYTVNSKLKDLPIENGQLIFTADVNEIHLDFNNKRTTYTQLKVLDNDTERLSMLAPVELMYFVKDTGILWMFTKGEWLQLTTNPVINIVYENDKTSFPTKGKGYILYISTTENLIYRWDDSDSTYKPMGVSEYKLEQTINELKSYSDSKIVELDIVNDLPTIGKSGTIYIIKSENKTYRWDDTGIKYYCIGSDYNDIQFINANF